MNRMIFWRLVWKEYRVQRAFWIVMAVLTVLIQLLIVGFATNSVPVVLPLTVAWVMTVLYALGCGAVLFAAEHETGTFEFQRALPVSARQVFVSKIAFGLPSILVFFVLSSLAAVLTAGGEQSRHGNVWLAGGVFGVGALYVFAWSILFSLLLRSPLKAVIFTVPAVLLSLSGGSNVSYWWTGHSESGIPILLSQAVMAAIVALVDLGLGLRWLKTPRLPLPVGWLRLWEDGAIEPHTGTTDLAQPSRSTVLLRLIWQQWRQSGRLMLVMTSLTAVWALVELGSRDLGFVALMAIVVPPILGVLAFQSDQQRNHFRFFAEHGISPRYVWLSRQLSWGVAMLVWLVLLTRAAVIGDRPYSMVVLLMAPVACTLGQLCSMLLRSGILAAFVAVMMTLALSGWGMLMWKCQYHWLWSVLPIPLALLLATWLRAPDWILERSRFRDGTGPALTLGLTTVGLLTAFALVRVYEVPEAGPDFPPKEFAQPVPQEARDTATMYQRAVERLTPVRRFVDENDTEPSQGSEASPKVNAAWLAANDESLTLALKASRRQECDALSVSWAKQDGATLSDFEDLGQLVIASGRQLEQAGDLDGALERYLAVLRMAGHARQRSAFPNVANTLERVVYDPLVHWATRPGQTAERLRDAMQRLDTINAAIPFSLGSVRTEYLGSREFIIDDWTDDHFAKTFWDRILFWEKTRALRILAWQTAKGLRRIQAVEQAITTSHPVEWKDADVDRQEKRLVMTTPPICMIAYEPAHWQGLHLLYSETRRRVLRLQWALAAYKLEHGKLPRSLDELAGPYLDHVPLAPVTAEPFRYFPDGVPIPLFAGKQQANEAPRVQAGQPFLWAASQQVCIRNHDAHPVERYRILADDNKWREPISEYDVWQQGWFYPVP